MENKRGGFLHRLSAWFYRFIPIVALLTVVMED